MKTTIEMEQGSGRQRILRQGFTLIELLVVLAITAVLFFLMLRPLIESLRLTQRAQLQAAAQDSARKTLEIMSREISSAVYVFDNASHPFVMAGGSFGAGDDHFTNFLDLEIPKNPTVGGMVVAHAYHAKLDLVPARHGGTSATTPLDPTTGEPITLNGPSVSGSAGLGSTGLQFPLAPGSSIIRYFVGLKDPTKPYTNTAERLGTGGSDNTYILYRVQFPLSVADKANAGKYLLNIYSSASNQDGLLRLGKDANNKDRAELDDPDFFRHVTSSDTDWLSAAHANYGGAGAESVTDHNNRVDNWMKIAKPIITAPNIDLLLLPREPDGTVAFDATTGVPRLSTTRDPVSGGTFPTVGTSVTFKPATLTADAAPATTSEYSSLGVPMSATDSEGLPYIPTVYTATGQSWVYPYKISLYPLSLKAGGPAQFNYGSLYLYTDIDPMGSGDIVEIADGGQPSDDGVVYDVTRGTAAANKTKYVPMVVSPDTGTINFAVPALPDPAKPLERYFTMPVSTLNTIVPNVPSGIVDLTDTTAFPKTPLAKNGVAPTGTQVANAHIVPGTVRVYGPDASPGPNQGNSILYQQVSAGNEIGFNQYRVDPLNSSIQLYVDSAHLLPTLKADNSTAAAETSVRVAYDFQANLNPITRSVLNGDSGTAITLDPSPNATPKGSNPALPMQVKVDYQTRDLLDISIGVRVYDPSNGQPFTVPVSSRVKVNNSNR